MFSRSLTAAIPAPTQAPTEVFSTKTVLFPSDSNDSCLYLKNRGEKRVGAFTKERSLAHSSGNARNPSLLSLPLQDPGAWVSTPQRYLLLPSVPTQALVWPHPSPRFAPATPCPSLGRPPAESGRRLVITCHLQEARPDSPRWG